MTPQIIPDAFPVELQRALETVWRQNSETVGRFALHYHSGGAIGSPPQTSWFVMITCDSEDPQAHELSTAIRHLEHEVETEFRGDVTLMLAGRSTSAA
jgi:hypothetical protein